MCLRKKRKEGRKILSCINNSLSRNEKGGWWRSDVGKSEISFAQRNRILNNSSIFFRPENRRRNDVKPHSPLRYAINGASLFVRSVLFEGYHPDSPFSSRPFSLARSTQKRTLHFALLLRERKTDKWGKREREREEPCALRESVRMKWYACLKLRVPFQRGFLVSQTT